HFQRRVLSFFPRMKTSEYRTVVRLIGVCDHSISTNRLVGFDAFSLRQNVFHLLENFARAHERCALWKLNVYAHDSLILVRNESCSKLASEEHGPKYDYTDDPDC